MEQSRAQRAEKRTEVGEGYSGGGGTWNTGWCRVSTELWRAWMELSILRQVVYDSGDDT